MLKESEKLSMVLSPPPPSASSGVAREATIFKEISLQSSSVLNERNILIQWLWVAI